MHSEVRSSRQNHARLQKFKLKLASIGFALSITLPFLFYPDNSIRIIESIFGHTVECANGIEPKNSGYLADAIVIPGGGGDGDNNSNFEPSPMAKLRLQAGAIAYERHVAPYIILLDGKSDPQQDQFMSRTYLKSWYKYHVGHTSTIPNDHILLESNSINTATNMAALGAIKNQYGFKSVIIVTNSYHRNRATLLACNYGTPAFSLSAEELIKDNDPSQANYLDDLYSTKAIKNEQLKEGIETALMYVDPKGVIPTKIKEFINK